MPRSIWKGTLSFGLVSIPVRVYGATEEKDFSFRQIHAEDSGRIKYKRVCDTCNEEIPFAEIAKGYETPDGRMAILTKKDFENLPLKTLKTVDVVQFVDETEIDPSYFQKTYFLEAEGPGAKPYVLMRDALAKTKKIALVKVALRSREALAVVRVKGDLLVMHTMLWPDELRDGSFASPPAEVTVSEAEVQMAEMLISQLEGSFAPEEYTDSYREALEEVVQARLAGIEPAAPEPTEPTGEVVDLVAALRASVEAAKARREGDKAAKSA
ncbi:MAG: Ku protein [Propionibacterium sp.]|nr:MAG: Ku protein [Propionibacterium sp.]